MRRGTRLRGWLVFNGLALVMFGAFAVFLALQSVFGWQAMNGELADFGRPPESYLAYVTSGDFVEATFENWESEFLQIGFYVLLTAFLVQRGSAESNPPGRRRGETVQVRADSPWAARPGRPRVVRWMYENSLSSALIGMFLLSFGLHLLGGTAAYDAKQALHGKPGVGVLQFLASPQFWFQSMQNWQSEFLAVGMLVVLSVVLRQRGSSQSKPVGAPHDETPT